MVTLADRLSTRLDELGLRLEPPLGRLEGGVPIPAILRHDPTGTSMRVTVVLQADMTVTSVSRLVRAVDSAAPLLLLGRRVHSSSADALRSMGVLSVDAAGNAYVESESLFIDVRGRRDHSHSSGSSPRLGTVNLFSPKRAQVIFAILSWPQVRFGPLRGIADCAGVSIGAVHETLDRLESFGFLDPDRRGGDEDLATLLDGWVGAYPSGLAASTRLGDFAGAPDRLVATDEPLDVSVGGRTADVKQTGELVVYVSDLSSALIGANRWRTDGRRNVQVRRRFWSAPDGSRAPAIRNAPPLLTFADLTMTGDPRLVAAARELRRRHDFPRAD